MGTVRLVIGAAEVDDLGVDTPEGIIVGEVSYKGQLDSAVMIRFGTCGAVARSGQTQ
jgi:hypothetical protein